MPGLKDEDVSEFQVAFVGIHTSVVHDQVNAPVLFASESNSLLPCLLLRDISMDEIHIFILGGLRLSPDLVHVDQNDHGSVFAETINNRSPKPVGAACK